MPRASIDYMNARRALMPASGGTQSRKAGHRYIHDPVTQAPADEWEQTIQHCRNTISEFSLWAEITRQQLCERLAIPQVITDEIPF